MIRVTRHLLWMTFLQAVAVLAQEDVAETFKRVRAQTIDVGAYTLRVLEVNNPESKFDGVTILWMQVPRDKVEINIEAIRKEGLTNEIYENSSSGDELVVLSAGFHDANNQPVGLFVSRGQVISSLASWTEGGVLYRKGPAFGIVPIRQWNFRPSDLDYAVQAKPLDVEDGRNGIVVDDGVLFDRVGIGFTTNGDLLVGGAFRKKNYRALSCVRVRAVHGHLKPEWRPGSSNSSRTRGRTGCTYLLPRAAAPFWTDWFGFRDERDLCPPEDPLKRARSWRRRDFGDERSVTTTW